MGSNSSSGGGGGGSNRYEPPKKKNPVVDFVKGGGVPGMLYRGIKKGAAESKAKKEANVEMGLGTDRMSNYSTGQGGTRSDGGNGNQVVQAPVVPKVISPTTAEVSQAAPEVTAEEARASANELIKKRRRGRGRSLSMLQTSSKGLDDKGLTLGKPTLLG